MTVRRHVTLYCLQDGIDAYEECPICVFVVNKTVKWMQRATSKRHGFSPQTTKPARSPPLEPRIRNLCQRVVAYLLTYSMEQSPS